MRTTAASRGQVGAWSSEKVTMPDPNRPSARASARGPTRSRVGGLVTAALALLALAVPDTTHALAWNPVPGPSPMNGVASARTLDAASRAGTPWLAFAHSNLVHVRRRNGTAWDPIGSGFSPSGNVIYTPRLAVTSTGTPLVAMTQASSSNTPQVWVMQWDGAAWSALGGSNLNSQNGQSAYTPSVAVDAVDAPAVAWSEKEGGGQKERRVWVRRWSGTAWGLLGAQLNQTTNNATSPSLAFSGTVPYVAFLETNASGVDQVMVKRWNGTGWELVGTSSLNLDPARSASEPFLHIDSGTPYLTWAEPDASGRTRAVVKRWNGSTWVQEGTAMVLQAAEQATRPRLATIGGSRYLTWSESYGARGGRAAIAAWTGSAWSPLPVYGADPRWAQKTAFVAAVDGGGTPWLTFAEGDPARVEVLVADSSDQTASGVLVPNGDLSSSQFSRQTPTWGGSCTTTTASLFQVVNEDIDQPLSTSCQAWVSNGEVMSSGTDVAAPTVDFSLTNAYPMSMAYSLRVRVRAHRTGTRTATLVARVRKADDTLLGTPVTWTLDGTFRTYEYTISSLSLSQADVDGLHLELLGSVGGSGDPTSIRVATANVGLDYVGEDCGTPPCPPIRPDNVAPRGGTALVRPTLSASEFVDTDFDPHVASHWQVRSDSGSWAAPLEDSGATATSLTAYTVATSLVLDQRYWFRVRYQDASGAWSDWSTETRFAIDTTPPHPPQGRRLSTRTTGDLEVIWDDAFDDHSAPETLVYDVEWSAAGTTWEPLCAGVLGPQACSVTVGSAATPGYFRVRATDQAGNVGAWGAYADATATSYHLRENVGSTLLTSVAVGTIDATSAAWTSTTTSNLNNLVGLWQFQRATSAASVAAWPASINPATTGRGWIFDALSGSSVNDGPVTLTFETTASKASGSANVASRMFRTATSGGNVAPPTSAPDDVVGSTNVLGATTAVRHDHVRSLTAPTTFASGSSLYFETWLDVSVAPGSAGGSQLVSMGGNPRIQMAQVGPAPSPATALAPAAAASTAPPLVMQATYGHASGIAGHLVFEVWSSSGGMPGVLLETGYSLFERAASGTPGSYAAVTLGSGTYHWRVRSEDRQGRVSAWSAFRTVTVTGSNLAPTTPTLVSPAAGSTTADTTPTLVASFHDPDGDTGSLEFEVCTIAMAAGQSCTGAGGVLVASGSSTGGVANDADGSWTSPTLATGTVHWHARGVDANSANGPWSASRSLVIGTPSMTVTIDSSSVALGVATPGQDVTGAARVTILTDNATGYVLSASDASDTWGMEQPTVDTIADWPGTTSAPSPWTPGTAGYFGITVLCVDATGSCSSAGTKDAARWGSGTTAGDLTTLRYAGLGTSGGQLHGRATYAAAAEHVTVGFRANASSSQRAGPYATTITFSAVANP